MKWLNYHHLLYFRAIAKEGSISKASEKLLVGQPALSTQLKQLEESLGVLLFERKNRSLVLTEAGRVALDYAEDIFNRGEEFLHAFHSKKFQRKSRYRLGAIAGLPKSLVCRSITMVKEIESDCFVSTFEGDNGELIQRLLNHDLDLVLTNDPGKPDRDVFRKQIGKAKVFVYGAPKFKELKDNFPKSLCGAPFVLQTMHSKLRYDIEQSFLSQNIQYDLVAECEDSTVKKALARMGEGLVFLPEFAAAGLLEDKSLIEIGAFEDLSEEYWLLSARKLIKNPITDKLLTSFQI